MDIDHPVAPQVPHNHYNLLPPTLPMFPLPYRVLFLVLFGIFLFALNLQLLHFLGIDTAYILGIRRGSHTSSGALILPDGDDPEEGYAKSGSLPGPVWGLLGASTAWVSVGWAIFRWGSGGNDHAMDQWRWVWVLSAAGLIGGLVMPYNGLWKRERVAFTQ